MNWNIRNQFLVPVGLIFFFGIAIATWINVQQLIRWENERIRRQVDDLVATLSEKSFPLTESVLRQIHQISGVHLIALPPTTPVDPRGIESSLKSGDAESVLYLLDGNYPDSVLAPESGDSPVEGESVTWSDGSHVSFVYRIEAPNRNLLLYAFYPQSELDEAIAQTIFPQIITGSLTLIVGSTIIFLVAANLSRPIRRLREKVLQIADGKFLETPTERKDEIGDLYRSIDQMSSQLKVYERQIRAQEKLMTLDQMGGGIAHQLRNSITGCRLALDMHRESCTGDAESLDVATRQLIYMENFQKKFLAMARESQLSLEVHDIGQVVRDYLPLLQPIARHASVQLEADIPDKPVFGQVDREQFEQVLNNLIQNGIEASATQPGQKTVRVTVQTFVEERIGSVAPVAAETQPSAIGKTEKSRHTNLPGRGVEVKVIDNGPGVDSDIADEIFTPLTSRKPDGVGLGLAIVRQTVERHGGSIRWNRSESNTEFIVRLPGPEIP